MEDLILGFLFVVLLLLAYYIHDKNYLKVSTKDISNVKINELIKICGEVVWKKDYKGVCKFKLKDNYGFVLCVDFYGCPYEKNICVIGRKSLYKGRSEVVVLRYLASEE